MIDKNWPGGTVTKNKGPKNAFAVSITDHKGLCCFL